MVLSLLLVVVLKNPQRVVYFSLVWQWTNRDSLLYEFLQVARLTDVDFGKYILEMLQRRLNVLTALQHFKHVIQVA